MQKPLWVWLAFKMQRPQYLQDVKQLLQTKFCSPISGVQFLMLIAADSGSMNCNKTFYDMQT